MSRQPTSIETSCTWGLGRECNSKGVMIKWGCCRESTNPGMKQINTYCQLWILWHSGLHKYLWLESGLSWTVWSFTCSCQVRTSAEKNNTKITLLLAESLLKSFPGLIMVIVLRCILRNCCPFSHWLFISAWLLTMTCLVYPPQILTDHSITLILPVGNAGYFQHPS